MPIPLEKAQRRLSKVSDDFINKEEKVNFAKVVFPDMMSSKEEKEDRNRKGYWLRVICYVFLLIIKQL